MKIYKTFDDWWKYVITAPMIGDEFFLAERAFNARSAEIEQLKARLVSFESRYTCFNCLHGKSCKFAFDEYNTNGDCLAEK